MSLPICAVCVKPIEGDPHTYHEPACPVVDDARSGGDHTDAAVEACTCDTTREVHEECCAVCRELVHYLSSESPPPTSVS